MCVAIFQPTAIYIIFEYVNMVESKYKKGELLGSGGFGMVYKCTRISDDKQLAMKEILFTYENR